MSSLVEVGEIGASLGDVQWAVSVRVDGQDPVEIGVPADTLHTASVGKVLLLLTTARMIDAGELDPSAKLAPGLGDTVADSGIWQHLRQESFRVDDLAALVGAVSDNLATNVLLSRIGLAAVERTRASLGLERTRLLDKVRDERAAGDPEALSIGSATELRGLFEYLRRDRTSATGRVNDWLRIGCDLSMVASAFGLDPLAHVEEDRGFRIVNKTGTNKGVRADAGIVEGPARGATYAALFNWAEDLDPRDEVLGVMRDLGYRLRASVSA